MLKAGVKTHIWNLSHLNNKSFFRIQGDCKHSQQKQPWAKVKLKATHFKILASFSSLDEEEKFIEKITQVARSGKKVTVIVCYDDFNPYKKLRSEIDEEQHFLFNHLRNQFAIERNITMEFVYIWDVLEILTQLAKDNANTFVFDFSFNDRSDEEKMAEYVESFSLPEVNSSMP